MRNILWGIAIIAIGLINGGSVFLGHPQFYDYFFDGLGIFFIGFGIVKVIQSRGQAGTE